MLVNIGIGLILIGVTVTIQAYGTNYWLNYITGRYTSLSSKEFDNKTVKLLIFTALFLLLLNFIEAIVWAVTYYFLPGITEFDTLEKAIYFSLVTFTTLGYGDVTIISSNNRILSGFEAMNGILLLGWSTTLMFSVMQFILKRFSKHTINSKDHSEPKKK